MVTVNDILLNPRKKTAKLSLFVDNKSDVTASMEIDEMPAGYTIAQSSMVMTADGDVAFMRSDGAWNWVE